MVLSGDLSHTSITSARLALRAFTAADAAESFEEASATIARFMSWNPPASEREFETIWQGHLSHMKLGTELHLVIRLNGTDEFVGRAGLHPADGSRSRRKVMDTGEKLLYPAAGSPKLLAARSSERGNDVSQATRSGNCCSTTYPCPARQQRAREPLE